MATIQQRPYRSYLLRLKQTYHDGRQSWCAALESAQTGESVHFANLAELFAYLAQQVHAADQQYEEEVLHQLIKDW